MTDIKNAGRVIDRKVKYLKSGGAGRNPIEKIVRDMRSRLITRVQSGKDHKGSGFQEYAQVTKDKKTDLGRDPELVDMTDEGTMLKNVAVSSQRNYADVYLAARKKIGMKHQKGIGVPERAWFGYTKKNRKKAEKDYNIHIGKALRK